MAFNLAILPSISVVQCTTGLSHARGEVRQMSSALLNNMSLALSATLPDTTDGEDVSDEATQILFGVLDDLKKETSPVREE